MMPKWKNTGLPVGQRPCPRCQGNGTIPKRGGRIDEVIVRSHEWAQSLHGQIVCVDLLPGWFEPFFGVAVAWTGRGGFGIIKVFTPTKLPEYSPSGLRYPSMDRRLRFPFPYTEVGWTKRDTIQAVPAWEVSPELKAMTPALIAPEPR